MFDSMPPASVNPPVRILRWGAYSSRESIGRYIAKRSACLPTSRFSRRAKFWPSAHSHAIGAWTMTTPDDHAHKSQLLQHAGAVCWGVCLALRGKGMNISSIAGKSLMLKLSSPGPCESPLQMPSCCRPSSCVMPLDALDLVANLCELRMHTFARSEAPDLQNRGYQVGMVLLGQVATE